jgi:Alr-MurF fusion protein
MNLTPQQLSTSISGTLNSTAGSAVIKRITLDSRRDSVALDSAFFALQGSNHDAHNFVQQAYANGIRTFVVEREVELPADCSIIVVKDSLEALQQLARSHRNQFKMPVVAITGSNGKTVVKEWLNQILSAQFRIVRSPRSYNSQVGVPLSVFNMTETDTLALFEAGISQPGEMEKLARILSPTIGIITNVRTAHLENFSSREALIDEKLKLFKNASTVVYCRDDETIHQKLLAQRHPNQKHTSFGTHPESSIIVENVQRFAGTTSISIKSGSRHYALSIPFTDEASIENALLCASAILALTGSLDDYIQAFSHLSPLEMRLQVIEGDRGLNLVNDAYSFDLDSLAIALDFLSRQSATQNKVAILSDLPVTIDLHQSYQKLGQILDRHGIDQVIAIGKEISGQLNISRGKVTRYESTSEALRDKILLDLHDADVLIKGARTAHFEQIVEILQKKTHGTRLEIDLAALEHNLNVYKSRLSPGTKLMVMVKAFAYGSGYFEVANLLQFNRVDYLAVAYADEGILLRERGISLPVMVMNASPETFRKLIRHNLEPEIFSLSQLRSFIETVVDLGLDNYAVHIKLDTGMHRLGFEEEDVDELISLMADAPLRIATVFSHLAASDDPSHDEFTRSQIELFQSLASRMDAALGQEIPRHIANTAGATRFPEAQFHMVRLGIGLYGVTGDPQLQKELHVVSRMTSNISQIKHIKAGESVGYARASLQKNNTTIATVPIGYADGYPRSLSMGIGEAYIKGHRVRTVGNVCMDMTMFDVSGLDVSEGDSIEIFGENLRIEELARLAGTISYEVLASIPQRVTRVYIHE